MKKLYKFCWDCGRQGYVEGMFIADEKEVKDAIGQEVYFGEILGKHSEVYGTLEEGEMKEVEVSEKTIEEMEKVIGTTISGYNPLHYIQYACKRCGDEMPVCESEWYENEDGEKICESCVTEEEKSIFKKL